MDGLLRGNRGASRPGGRASRTAVALAALTAVGCADAPAPPVWGEPGDPLPDVTPEELRRFEDGRALFARSFTEEEGLGPRFNENACNACHTFPTDGGTGETSVRKATRTLPDGRCDLLTDDGGENVRIQVTPRAAERGASPSPTIPEATHRALFTIPFLYGMGLVDAVPVSTLEAMADPDDRDGDGISGRLGRTVDGRPGRFGRKADEATLQGFVDTAFRLEMGLTTARRPDERLAGGSPPLPEGSDPAPEPEIDAVQLGLVTDFVRFLAPPRSGPPSDEAAVEQGREMFGSLGCTACHVPVLETGEAESPALDRRRFAIWSDLLLHDMGPGLEATCGPGASTTEFRTEPLMGLRYRELFLHDGRAGRIIDAILQHGGEAAAARDRFAGLDRVTQEVLLEFLRTL